MIPVAGKVLARALPGLVAVVIEETCTARCTYTPAVAP